MRDYELRAYLKGLDQRVEKCLETMQQARMELDKCQRAIIDLKAFRDAVSKEVSE